MSELKEMVEQVERDDIITAVTGEVGEQKPPKIGDAEWSDYVMKQFEADELMDGNPTVDGLRRVANKILGRIISSKISVVDPVRDINGFTVTAHCRLIILTKEYGKIIVEEVADANASNIGGSESATSPYAKYRTAIASTRAEGRALRKALMLKRIVSAEEISENVIMDSMKTPDFITSHQLIFMSSIGKKRDIDVKAFVNMGSKVYEDYNTIPYTVAQKMLLKLTEFDNAPDTIPAKIKGYKSDWRNK